MMPRRAAVVLIVAAVVAGPVTAGAQPAEKTVRIGDQGLDPAPSRYLDAFRAGLRRLGCIEGQIITIDARFADARWTRPRSGSASPCSRRTRSSSSVTRT